MKAALHCLVIMAYLIADSTTAQGSTVDIKCGVEELKEDVISRMETADEKLGNVEGKLDELEVQHNEHKKEMLTRMDAVDEKLDDLKQLLEQVIANKANQPPQWISIQRRGQYGNPADFFSKSMEEYKTGFGTMDKEFWLGLDELARLTKEGDWMMKVTMMDYDGNTYTGTYSLFRVGAGPRYEVEVGGYDDDQSTMGRDVFRASNMAFSTKDVDQDTAYDADCSNTYGGGAGWWFGSCGYIFINGQQTGNSKFEYKGMRAAVGKGGGADVMLKESEMFIKKSPKM